jgi:RNA polymerase sigma factor (sigma-70 family)
MYEAIETDDSALLAAFVRDGSPEAFRMLVDRHAGWVFAAAHRQLRDAHIAEDATQAVFLLLFQRAKKMKPRQKLSGWLFLTASYTVKSIRRSTERRMRHEKRAAMDRPDSSPPPPPLADDLDAAVSRLGENDQAAILLRFYQGLEFAAVAKRLGISDGAAKKRVARAVDRLRHQLGAAVSVEALIAASAVGAPPSAVLLSGNISQQIATSASSSTVPAGVAPALKGAVHLMAIAKAKVAAALVIIVLLMALSVVAGWELFSAPAEPAGATASSSPAATEPADLADTRTFEQVYGLQGSDILRLVEPPFTKARMDFYRSDAPEQARLMPAGPENMMILWRNGKPHLWGWTFNDGNGFQLSTILQWTINVPPQSVEGDPALKALAFHGDLVVKANADKDQLRIALQAMIARAAGEPVDLKFQDVERPTIVFRGKLNDAYRDASHGASKLIMISAANMRTKTDNGGGSGSAQDLANWIGAWIEKQVVIETPDAPPTLSWQDHDGDDAESRKQAHDPKLVCNYIQQQTGLTWTEETRKVRVLFITRTK